MSSILELCWINMNSFLTGFLLSSKRRWLIQCLIWNLDSLGRMTANLPHLNINCSCENDINGMPCYRANGCAKPICHHVASLLSLHCTFRGLFFFHYLNSNNRKRKVKTIKKREKHLKRPRIFMDTWVSYGRLTTKT